jgi:hypothetical protein
MTRITVLAGAAAALVLLGCAVLNADTRWDAAATIPLIAATSR